MSALNGTAALAEVPAARRRRRRGGRKQRERRLAAAAPALDALAEFRELGNVERICLALGRFDPLFPRIADRARVAALDRVRLLDRIGIHPQYFANAEAVINGQVYTLDDRLVAICTELLTPTSADTDVANPHQEDTMNQTATHVDQMNGSTPLAQPGFFGRAVATVKDAAASLRMPTVKEVGIGIVVAIVAYALYEAFTNGDVIEAAAALEVDAAPIA